MTASDGWCTSTKLMPPYYRKGIALIDQHAALGACSFSRSFFRLDEDGSWCVSCCFTSFFSLIWLKFLFFAAPLRSKNAVAGSSGTRSKVSV